MYVIMQKSSITYCVWHAMYPTRQALRLNVGFLLNQPVGSSRDFSFDLPEVFLEPDLRLENIYGTVRLTRTAQGILLQADMQAGYPSECARCLTGIDLSLQTEFTELYAFTQRNVSESGLILPEEGIIDMAPLLREYLILSIPINPLCSVDCAGLCPVCGESLTENPHTHAEESVDPRMDQLRSLLDQAEEREL